MKNLLKTILSSIIALLLFVSCQPDDPQPFNSDDLTSGTGKWILTELTVSTNFPLGSALNSYDILPDCVKDDIHYYTNTNAYQELSGDRKCDIIEPDILHSGTWSLSKNGRQLFIQYPGNPTDTFNIKQLNSTTLKLYSIVVIDGDIYSTTLTYTKQQ